jgi:hypothetical protein
MTQARSRRYSRVVFLNLSNHPSAGWSPRQLAEAEALGGGVVDEPFPDVPPEADASQIREIGARLVSRIAARAPSAAMVQGEFTLAFYLVSELESRGIACYAATTRRVTETRTLPGGAVEKTSRFEFVQFRRYGREC